MTPSNETYQNFFILILGLFAISFLFNVFKDPSLFNIGMMIVLGILPTASLIEYISNGVRKIKALRKG